MPEEKGSQHRRRAVATAAGALVAIIGVVWAIQAVGPEWGSIDLGFADDAARQPRADIVAFSSWGDIYVRDLSAREEALLVGGPEDDYGPVYSPDGTRLAFLRHHGDGDRTSVMIMNADGSGLRPLIDRDREIWRVDWSPDGNQIVVARYNSKKLSVVQTDGSGERRDLRTQAREARWLPGTDGFVTSDDTELNGKLSFLSADESVHRVLVSATRASWYAPTFAISPEGRLLAYLTDAGPELLDLATGQRVRRGGDEPIGGLRFAPDGRLVGALFFPGAAGTGSFQVHGWRVEAFGEPPRPIGPELEAEPMWTFSPDGQRVLVVPAEGDVAWVAGVGDGEVTQIDWSRSPDMSTLSWRP